MDSAKAHVAKWKELPHTEIIVTAAHVTDFSEVDASAFSRGGEYVVRPSIVIEFTNQATHGGPAMEPTISALLTYKDARRDLLQINGEWIDSRSELAHFKLHESHKLLIGVLQDGHFAAIGNEPTAANRARHNAPQNHHPIPDFQHGLVYVSLTDVDSMQLLYDSDFEIGTNPLRISQNISHRP